MSENQAIEPVVVAAVRDLPAELRKALAAQSPPVQTPPAETYYPPDQISTPPGWDEYQCWTVGGRVYLWDVPKDEAARTPRDQWQSPEALEAYRQSLLERTAVASPEPRHGAGDDSVVDRLVTLLLKHPELMTVSADEVQRFVAQTGPPDRA